MISNEYIAGFFDGEGSAMILTVRLENTKRTFYKFRPTITIAQKNRSILDKISNKIKTGKIIGTQNQCYKLQINGNRKILSFINQIGQYIIIKQKQIKVLKQIIAFQENHKTNTPYTKKEIRRMVELRDNIHKLNKINNPNLKKKYPKEKIMSEYRFINIKQWESDRNSKGTIVLNQHIASIKLPRIKIQCACGCGNNLTNRDGKGRQRKYIRGHNATGTHWKWRKNRGDLIQDRPEVE